MNSPADAFSSVTLVAPLAREGFYSILSAARKQFLKTKLFIVLWPVELPSNSGYLMCTIRYNHQLDVFLYKEDE